MVAVMPRVSAEQTHQRAAPLLLAAFRVRGRVQVVGLIRIWDRGGAEGAVSKGSDMQLGRKIRYRTSGALALEGAEGNRWSNTCSRGPGLPLDDADTSSRIASSPSRSCARLSPIRTVQQLSCMQDAVRRGVYAPGMLTASAALDSQNRRALFGVPLQYTQNQVTQLPRGPRPLCQARSSCMWAASADCCSHAMEAGANRASDSKC